MKHKRVVRRRVLDEPAHRVENVSARRLLVPVRCVVRQDEYVLGLEAPILCPLRGRRDSTERSIG